MGTNWGYLAQQGILLALATLIAGLAVIAIGRIVGRAQPGLRLLLELPAVSVLLWLVGLTCQTLGYGRLLPGYAIPLFFAIGLTFYWLAVLWPLRVFWLRREIAEQLGGGFAQLVALVLPLVAGYACFIEPRMLEAEARTLTFRDVSSPIRVAHLTDLQLLDFGGREQAVIDAVNAFEPHLIVMTGDYISAHVDDTAAIAGARHVLGSLKASHGIFATIGHSDSFEQRDRIFDGLGVHYLINANATIEIGGTRVRVGCVDHDAPQWAAVGKDSNDDELFIVACHTPDLAEVCAKTLPTADVFFCGHTHGGQVQVPGFGPIITMSNVPRSVAAGGVFETETGLPLVLSRGIGMEGNYAPRFRFNCRPHLFLLTLTGPEANK